MKFFADIEVSYLQGKQSLISLKALIFLFHATNTIVLSFLPLYLRYKGLNGTEIGWVLAIGPFASLISQPFWGYLSDKYKTVKRMLILSVVGMLIGSMLFFQMNTLVLILVFAAFFYFFSSPVGALSDSLAQRRALELNISFGSIRMWGSIGFAFSALIVGEILDVAGIQYMLWPYLTCGTMLLIVAFTIQDVKTDATPVSLADVKLLLQNKAYVLFLVIVLIIGISHRANDSYIGLYITELGGSENLVGLAWFIGVISEASVFALAPLWFRKYHPISFILLASVLYSLRWLFYGTLEHASILIGFQVLHGLTFGIFYVTTFAYVTSIIPKHLQATGHLIFYSVLFGITGIVGSLTGGVIIDHYGGTTLYYGMGILAALGVMLLIISAPYLKRHAT